TLVHRRSHRSDLGYAYFARMNRQKERNDSRREDDLESKKRRVDKDDDIGRRVKKEVYQEEEEVQILFFRSKDQSKRNDSTEELLKKAKEKNKSLKAQLKESKENEAELSRRVEQFELLWRVKTETAEELLSKSEELARINRLFEGACLEARKAQLRAEEAEKKLAEVTTANSAKGSDDMMRNLKQEQRISGLIRERDRLKKEVDTARRNMEEKYISDRKLEDMHQENRELKEKLAKMEQMLADADSLNGHTKMLERKLKEETEERSRL
ncbi:hypothetical protein PMAYCL1PPCAC_25907, partial [Pristionchus mayeri]